MAFHLSPLVNLIYTEDWANDMEDFSHCHYWDNKRECIALTCDERCKYFVEYKEAKNKVKFDEDLFEI